MSTNPLRSCLLQPLAMRLLHKRSPTEPVSMPDKVNRRVDKFCESLWKVLRIPLHGPAQRSLCFS